MIYFSKKAYQKLKYFVQNVDTEISGLGESEIITPDMIGIDNIEIFPQSCTKANTKLDEDELAKFLYNKTIKNEDVSKYNIWFHSHNDASVFWSYTDEHTIETTTSNAYLISLVVNKKMEMLARLDIFKPFRLTLPLAIHKIQKVRNSKKIKEYCLNRITECIKKPQPFIKDRKIYSIPIDSKKQLILSESEIRDLIQQCPWLKWDLYI